MMMMMMMMMTDTGRRQFTSNRTAVRQADVNVKGC